jgi:hypothetical protein
MIEYPLTTAVLARLRDEAAVSGITGLWDGLPVGRPLTNGGCALFAAALAVRHGLPVIAAGQAECCRTILTNPFADVGPCCALANCARYGDDRCCCHAHHFYVGTLDGWLVDVYGEHDAGALVPDVYGGLYPWTDRALASLLETWHLGNADDADLVFLALDLAARPFAEVRFGLDALEVAEIV